MLFETRLTVVRGLTCWIVALLAAMAVAAPAHAAFHLWNIQEIYTNSSGTLQFIELKSTSAGQTSLQGQTLSIVGGGTVTIPSNISDSTNKFLLFGTTGITGASGVTPDYIIPSNFLPTGGGQISYFGNSTFYSPITYGALPTNGTAALDFLNGLPEPNSVENFAGATGVVPEPMVVTPVAAGFVGLYCLLRRRAAGIVSDPAKA